MEKQYNYQIKGHNDHRDWEQIEVHSKPYSDRVQALYYAQRLARVFNAEIRFTEGTDHSKTSGTYIRENN